MLRARDEQGDTLIEVLLTTVILGIGVAGLLGGVGLGVSLASVQHDRAVAESALRSYAESVRSLPYASCATATTSYTAGMPTVAGVTPLPPVVSCTGDLLQVVTVSVRSADPRVGDLSLEVAKSTVIP